MGCCLDLSHTRPPIAGCSVFFSGGFPGKHTQSDQVSGLPRCSQGRQDITWPRCDQQWENCGVNYDSAPAATVQRGGVGVGVGDGMGVTSKKTEGRGQERPQHGADFRAQKTLSRHTFSSGDRALFPPLCFVLLLFFFFEFSFYLFYFILSLF